MYYFNRICLEPLALTSLPCVELDNEAHTRINPTDYFIAMKKL